LTRETNEFVYNNNNDETHTPQPLAKDTWWNGIYVAILQN